MKKQYMQICPKCNSSNIVSDTSNPALVSTGLFSNSFSCENCGYTGTFFPEVEVSQVKPVKKSADIPKRELVNTKYGSNINWWWRKVGPVMLLISIILLFFYNISLLFYLGLIELLPFSIIITLASYKPELMQKSKVLRAISFIVYIYSFTIGPVLVSILALKYF